MIMDVRGVSRSFRAMGRPPVVALDDVYLRVPEGGTLGLVGESGSGKSTLLRCLMRLEKPDEGRVLFRGQDALPLRGRDLKAYRRQVQMVFQDPAESLNPRMTVERLVGEGMLVHALERSPARRRDRVAQLLEEVGMPPDAMARYPASFSGGQLQRIAIARALAVQPSLLVCDEPVSALDVSVQAQVLNLLLRTQAATGLSILFVSHDLAVVRYLCPSIAVLEKGRIVEESSREELFRAPRTAYTRALIDAVPNPDPVRPGPDARTGPSPGRHDEEGRQA
jgi:oligopeptide transport system ATP-binding protein